MALLRRVHPDPFHFFLVTAAFTIEVNTSRISGALLSMLIAGWKSGSAIRSAWQRKPHKRIDSMLYPSSRFGNSSAMRRSAFVPICKSSCVGYWEGFVPYTTRSFLCELGSGFDRWNFLRILPRDKKSFLILARAFSWKRRSQLEGIAIRNLRILWGCKV